MDKVQIQLANIICQAFKVQGVYHLDMQFYYFVPCHESQRCQMYNTLFRGR